MAIGLKRSLLGLGLVFFSLLSWQTCSAADLTEDEAYRLATQAFNQGNWEDARAKFSQFQSQYPQSRWHWAAVLRLADLETEPAKAEKMYLEVMERANPEWARDAQWSLGGNQYAAGRYAEALKQYRAMAASPDPRNIRALYQAGACQFALKNFEEARVVWKELLLKYPESDLAGAALVGQGDAESALGNTQASQAAYAEYLKKYPQGEWAGSVAEKMKSGSPAPIAAPLKTAEENTVTPVAAAPTKPDNSDGAGKLCVQVGAFTKPEYAQALVKKLKTKGYSAYILDATAGEELFHQVRVGRYNQRSLAEKISQQLSQKEKLPAIIVPFAEPAARPAGGGKVKPRP